MSIKKRIITTNKHKFFFFFLGDKAQVNYKWKILKQQIILQTIDIYGGQLLVSKNVILVMGLNKN